MLPEFRKLKLDLAREIKYSIQTGARKRGALSEIHDSTVHEGDRFTLHREDGSVETKPFVAMEATVELSPDDVQSDDAVKVAEAVDDLTEQLARHASKKLFETVREAVQAVGNEVDGAGRPFTAELWLDGLDRIEMDFEEDGSWRPPTLVMHPTMLSRAQAELGRLDTDVQLRKRLEHILNRKRDEWRVREANRKLVD